jgi:hypothetical protein
MTEKTLFYKSNVLEPFFVISFSALPFPRPVVAQKKAVSNASYLAFETALFILSVYKLVERMLHRRLFRTERRN